MRYRFEVVVSLRPGLLDPQGKAIESALPAMGWTNVSEVRVGKHITLSVEADSLEEARAQGDVLVVTLTEFVAAPEPCVRARGDRL